MTTFATRFLNSLKNKIPYLTPLVVALLSNFFFLVLFLVLGSWTHTSLDDYFMSALMTGAYGGLYDVHLYFINVAFAYLLKPFYLLFPNFGWYYFFEIVSVFISFSTISYIVIKNMGMKCGFPITLLILCAISPDFYFQVSFTQNAALLSASGMLLIYFGELDKRIGLLLFGIVMLAFGFVMRKEEFLLGLPFLFLLILFLAYKIKRIPKMSVCALAVTFAMIGGLNYFNHIHYENNEYEYYAKYQAPRAVFVDGDYYDVEATFDELEERGLSGRNFKLYRSWRFYDTELFSLEKMEPMLEVIYRNHFDLNYLKLPLTLLYELSSKYFSRPIAWGWAVLCVLIILFAGKERQWIPWLSFAMTAGGLSWLLMVNRVVDHVVFGLWIYAIVFILPVVVDLQNPIILNRERKIVVYVFLAVLYFFNYWGQPALQKRFGEENPEKIQWALVKEYIQNHREQTFLLDLNQYQNVALLDRNAFRSIAAGSWNNIIPIGFWNVYWPALTRELLHRGVKNPLREIIDPNIYVFGNHKKLAYDMYFFENYNLRVAADSVCRLGDLEVLKYHLVE